MKLLSFVIPCYGSEKTITPVIDEIISVVKEQQGYDYEVIVVNDCSPDNVWSVLKTLAEKNNKIKAVNFSKNMGKHAALMAGFRHVIGDYVIYLDDDGQCPVPELFQLIEKIENGYDVATVRYISRKQSIIKNLGSYINNAMATYLLQKPGNARDSNFVALKRFVVDEVIKYDNSYPYVMGLILRVTHNIAAVRLEDRCRLAGRSGFTLYKSVSLLLNGLTAFSVKPLRIASVLGMLCALFGFILGLYIVIKKLIYPDIFAGYTSIMAVLLAIGGMLMCMLGLIGEYIGRIYISINNSPQYVIKDKINL